MIFAAFNHGEGLPKTPQPGLLTDNENISKQQERTTIAPRGNHLSKESSSDRKANVNNAEKTNHSRILARLASSPSPLPLAEAETPSVEPEVKAEAEAEAEAWPEAGPDWSIAFEEWGAAWEFHIYVFALIFLGFGIYSAYFIGHGLHAGLNQKYLGFCLNVVMFILGFTRAFVLFTDPYHQGDLIHSTVVMRVMWSLANPCLTSADCLVILALVETAKISLAPPKMQKLSVILKITILHFILVLTSDFVVSEFLEAKAMLLFCQIFFIVWGSVLGVGYCVLGYKLDQMLFSHKEVKTKKDLLYIRLIYASGVNNFILCAMYIYSSAGVFGVYSDVKFVDAWSWWAIQTCFRVSEVLSGILVFKVSAKRKSLKKNANRAATMEYELEGDTLGDDFAQPVTSKPATVTATQEKDRKLSMFSQLYSKKVRQNTATDKTLAPQKEVSEHSMLEDLHEAKLEAVAYHEHAQTHAQEEDV